MDTFYLKRWPVFKPNREKAKDSYFLETATGTRSTRDHFTYFLGSATIGIPALWIHQKLPPPQKLNPLSCSRHPVSEVLLAVTEILPAAAKALSTPSSFQGSH